MLRIVLRILPALFCAGLLSANSLHAQLPAVKSPVPDAYGRETIYDDKTKELVLRGDARVTYGDVTLTAEEIRYSRETNTVLARGRFILTNGGRRLVAEEGSYNLTTGILRVRNLRVGQFPIYITGESVEGTFEEMVFTNATIFFREEASYSPSIKAARATYRRGRIVAGEGLQIGLLGGHVLKLPHFEHDLTTELFSLFSGKIGYRRSLGVLVEGNLRVPLAEGVRVGGDIGLYSARGVMVGPALKYARTVNGDSIQGALTSGYIKDNGDRLTDILGRAIPTDRSFVEWTHHQSFGARGSLDAQFNYWSDSEILRDFRSKRFFPVQQPDSYLETAYAGDNYLLSAFLRVHPNRFHRTQQRLPEIRYDLLPTEITAGAYHRLAASFAVLEENAFALSPKQQSTRFDAYYGVERPIALAPWLAFTPVAGGRLTHYVDALGARNDYTRTIGEIGFDARLRATGTFEYRNDTWEINGLRHLFEPRLSYRYAPRADRGKIYIPQIDRRVYSTYLQPLSIADQRNIDDLDELNTLRFGLHNTWQTRATDGGTRELAALNLAADYRFSRRPGQRPVSDVHAELKVTPAPWLRLEVYQRFTPQTQVQQELNYALVLTDQDWWSARLSSYFLKNDYEEYSLDYRYRLNEAFEVIGRWRYDVRRSRLNEQTYGLWQRLGQTWAVRYEASFYNGPRRENSFAFNIEVELLKF